MADSTNCIIEQRRIIENGKIVAVEITLTIENPSVDNIEINRINENGVNSTNSWSIDMSQGARVARKMFTQEESFSLSVKYIYDVGNDGYSDVYEYGTVEILFVSSHEKVYAICENMCLEETMTKGQIEAIINNINNKFVCLTGTISLVNGIGSVTGINYPSKFNKENCIVISVGLAVQTADSYSFGYHTSSYPELRLTNSAISLYCNSTGAGPNGIRNYKIVLMRID